MKDQGQCRQVQRQLYKYHWLGPTESLYLPYLATLHHCLVNYAVIYAFTRYHQHGLYTIKRFSQDGRQTRVTFENLSKAGGGLFEKNCYHCPPELDLLLRNGPFCVDFSFCCINVNPMTFSLEQNILVVSRQTFILC